MIFLRPLFLLLLLVPAFLWLFKRRLSKTSRLSKFIDAQLLPFVTVHFGRPAGRPQFVLAIVVWCFLVVAGAGPAFEKIKVPAVLSAPSTVIVMDLSPVMSGPTLGQAKRKMYDFLDMLKMHQVGFVLYDEQGYTVSPVTQDSGIIREMIPALDPSVLPSVGVRADAGFEQAAELLKNVGDSHGTIVFLTAGGFEADALKQFAAGLPYKIASLAFGDVEGLPVPSPDGGFVRHADGTLARVFVDEKALSDIGLFLRATPDDVDLKRIRRFLTGDSADQGESDGNQAEIWHDSGPLLLLISALFFAALFRRGVIFVLVLGFSFSASAGLFLRPDQEAYQSVLKGIDAYRSGEYLAAKEAFESGNRTAISYYNAGNALAHLNDINGAIAAYSKALSLDPDFTEAKQNKAYLEKQLSPPPPPQENQTEQNQQGDPNNQSESSQKNQQGDGNDQDESSQSPTENTEQNRQNQRGETQDVQAQKQPANHAQDGQGASSLQQGQGDSSQKGSLSPSGGQMQEEPAPEFDNSGMQESGQPLDQESQQMLNRIRHDPSRLLRYRLQQQWRQKHELL